MTYEHTEDPRSPLQQAQEHIGRAGDELIEIRLGPLDKNDRAALDRAKQNLKAAIARIDDVERASRPVIVHRHPGGEARQRTPR